MTTVQWGTFIIIDLELLLCNCENKALHSEVIKTNLNILAERQKLTPSVNPYPSNIYCVKTSNSEYRVCYTYKKVLTIITHLLKKCLLSLSFSLEPCCYPLHRNSSEKVAPLLAVACVWPIGFLCFSGPLPQVETNPPGFQTMGI